MKIKKVAIIIQNIIQYESFSPAIDALNERKIKVDILVPSEDISEHIWDNMYDKTSSFLLSKGLNVKRKIEPNDYYDIVFSTHEIAQFKFIKRKYFIKYRYGSPSKPQLSVSYRKNYMFDAILCYGKNDEECLCNYGKTFIIGNIKYAYYKKKKREKNNKLNVLYLPTYGYGSSYYDVVPELIKLKEKYNIMIKLHHGTNYLDDVKEKEIKKLVYDNFNNIYESEDSLLEIFQNTDIVISDNSGAVGDAVCAGLPVIIYSAIKNEYGEYITLFQKMINSGIISIKKPSEVEDGIKKASSKEYSKILPKFYSILYDCKNDETKEKFNDAINQIESGFISDDYLAIRKNMIKEYEEITTSLEKYSLENEVLSERLQISYQNQEKLSKELEQKQDIFLKKLFNKRKKKG